MGNVDRVLIFTGGNLGDWAIGEIVEGDFIIGVDRGALYLIQGGVTPHLALGDFDSISQAELAIVKDKCQEVNSYDPIDKNHTDTELAFYKAIDLDPREILLLGATGSRFDHTLANVQLLVKGLQAKVTCKIKDDNNQIQIIDNQISLSKEDFTYVSLLPLSYEVRGITLKGFRYPLTDATLTMGHSLGISNQIEADRGQLSISSGLLLVIQSRDSL